MIRKIIESPVQSFINAVSQSSLRYAQDEVCPICGAYSPDGDVCPNCLKTYNLYKPRVSYLEE